MKKGVLLLTLFILITNASAEIIINDLGEIYSAGDNINASISIQKQESAADYLQCYLGCGERLLVHKQYYNVEGNKKREIVFGFPASLNGKCHLEVIFDGENKDSQEFEISDAIELDYSLNNKLFFPSEKLFINGSAKKKNGEKLKGFVRISLDKLENRTIDVSNGNFSFEFQIKKDAAPGKYALTVEAFEKNAQEQIINYGKKTEEIEIKGKPTTIKIEADEAVKPPLNFSAKISLLDQAGGFVNNGTIIVKLFNPSGEIVSSREVESGGIFIYSFPDDSSRQSFWHIRAYYGDIFSEKPISIEDNEKISIDIINDSRGSYVVIRNIGNVNYTGNVFLLASSSSREENISIPVGLGLGEEMRHTLNLSGVFNISVGEKKFMNIPLSLITPAAIFPELTISLKSYLYFFILLLILFAFYLLIKKIKKRRKAKKTGEKEENKQPEPQKGENLAFMIFFRFDKYVEGVRELVEKENLSLTKLSDNLYYILFYSDSNRNPEIFSYSLAKKVRNKAMAGGQGVSIAINSGAFHNKEKFLKDFSLLTRKMVDHAKGGILVSEDIFKKIKLRAEKSLVFRENGESYRMYKV